MARKAMTTTLNIRDIHASAARAIKGGADELGLTLGQYLHRLALLLLASRERARADEETARTLQHLGLVPPPPVPENWQAPRLTCPPSFYDVGAAPDRSVRPGVGAKRGLAGSWPRPGYRGGSNPSAPST